MPAPSRKRIYLASSWRNIEHRNYIHQLRGPHDVYDFTSNGVENPLLIDHTKAPSAAAFAWNKMDSDYKHWTPSTYREQLLKSQVAAQGYVCDHRGMEWADTCVLLLPAGPSAHIEAGYMKGRGKRLIVCFPSDTMRFLMKDEERKFEPDLMYLLADNIVIGIDELLDALA